jgi:hypothetical protein
MSSMLGPKSMQTACHISVKQHMLSRLLVNPGQAGRMIGSCLASLKTKQSRYIPDSWCRAAGCDAVMPCNGALDIQGTLQVVTSPQQQVSTALLPMNHTLFDNTIYTTKSLSQC